jgi:hypothetical protein
MSIDFQGKKFYPRFHGASASALCFRQIFGHWKTLLLFLFRLSARTGLSGQQVLSSSTHIQNYGKAQNSFFHQTAKKV